MLQPRRKRAIREGQIEEVCPEESPVIIATAIKGKAMICWTYLRLQLPDTYTSSLLFCRGITPVRERKYIIGITAYDA